MDFSGGFLTKIAKSNYATGVEHFIAHDGTVKISAVIVRKRGKLLKIISRGTFDSIESFEDSIKNIYPVYMSIDGRIVLHKEQLSQNAGNGKTDPLPDMNDSELLAQTVIVGKKNSIVSYIRRNSLDALLSSFYVRGYYLHSVTLGPLSCVGMADASGGEKVVKLPYYDLQLSADGIESIHKRDFFNEDQFLSIGDENIESAFLVPFFNTVIHFGGQGLQSLPVESIKNNKREFLFKSILSRAGLPIIAGFFLILLCNFLAYENLHSKNMEMVSFLEKLRPEIEKFDSLNRQIAVSDKFNLQVTTGTMNMMAYYSDRIAGSIPGGLRLLQMSIAPPEKRVPGRSQPEFRSDIISITGLAESSLSVNVWISLLKEFSWIADIQLLNFSDDGKGMSEFSMEIRISEQ